MFQPNCCLSYMMLISNSTQNSLFHNNQRKAEIIEGLWGRVLLVISKAELLPLRLEFKFYPGF